MEPPCCLKPHLPLTKNPNCVYLSDCLLAGPGTDWLTVNLSSRCTAEGNRILSTLHPSTILKPNPAPHTHPNPQPSPNPTPSPTPTPSPKPSPIKTEYWDRAGGGGNINYDW